MHNSDRLDATSAHPGLRTVGENTVDDSALRGSDPPSEMENLHRRPSPTKADIHSRSSRYTWTWLRSIVAPPLGCPRHASVSCPNFWVNSRRDHLHTRGRLNVDHQRQDRPPLVLSPCASEIRERERSKTPHIVGACVRNTFEIPGVQVRKSRRGLWHPIQFRGPLSTV